MNHAIVQFSSSQNRFSSLFYVLHSVLFHSKIALLSIVYSGLSSGSRVQTNREFRWSISSTTWSSYTQNTTKDFKQNTNIRKAEKQSEKKQRTEPWTNTNGGSQWGNKVGISCELNSESDFSTTRSFVGFVFFFSRLEIKLILATSICGTVERKRSALITLQFKTLCIMNCVVSWANTFDELNSTGMKGVCQCS